ncbi:MAG: FAD-dependent oxidoreductase [Rhizobiaceae bacterium]
MSRVLEARNKVFDTHVPVIIVGAGACGLVSALKAHDCGAEVLVLEQDETPSGSTALSSGFVPAAGTRFQTARGISDSPGQFARDLQYKSNSQACERLVHLAARSCGPALEWLADDHGLEWTVIEDFLYPGHSCHRMHAVPEKTGAAMMGRLLNAVEAASIPVATGARVSALFAEGRNVRGVEVSRSDGQTETIGCDAIVLACCGYGGNAELVSRHVPEMREALFFGHAGNRGDAYLWTKALGAAHRDMTGYQGHGSVATPQGVLITWALMMEGGIQVNENGQRFSDETRGYSEQASDVLNQPGGIVWDVYDTRIHELGLGFEDYRQAVETGAIRSGDDLAGLCQVTNLPEEEMAATLEAIEDARLGRAADMFGREFSKTTPLRPPYFAVKVTGAMFHTQGGAMIDETARVVDEQGKPLGNICAGGGAACGVSGPEASGYLSGNGLLTAIAFGSIAGQTAAKMTAN